MIKLKTEEGGKKEEKDKDEEDEEDEEEENEEEEKESKKEGEKKGYKHLFRNVSHPVLVTQFFMSPSGYLFSFFTLIFS